MSIIYLNILSYILKIVTMKINFGKNTHVLSFFIIPLFGINLLYIILLCFSQVRIKQQILYFILGLLLNFSYLFYIFLESWEWMIIKIEHILYPLLIIYYICSEIFKLNQKINYIIYSWFFVLISLIPTLLAIFVWFWDDGIYDYFYK